MNPVSTMSTLLGATALLAIASTSQGAVLAQYAFTSGSSASTDADSSSTAGNFTFTGASGKGGFSASSGTAFVFSDVTGADAAAAAADTDFLSFTITANSGQVLNLSSLTLDFGASNNTTTGGPASFTNTLYVSKDGAVLGTATYTVGQTNGAPSFVSPSPSFDLSDAQYQGLTSITLRFAFSDDDGDAALAIHRLDNVVLNGTTALVPEPTLLALAPLGLAALTRRRRR